MSVPVADYHTGWDSIRPAPDLGHDWGPTRDHFDGAVCRACGLRASNAQIASASTPVCLAVAA